MNRKYVDVWDQSIEWGTQSGMLDHLVSEGQKIMAARVLAIFFTAAKQIRNASLIYKALQVIYCRKAA